MPRQIKDEDIGLKILVNPDDASQDVLAIHGTGAHPDDTWCKLREKDDSSQQDTYINWLQDAAMLPHVLPTARIMRYGYRSAWFGHDTIITSPSQISDLLLNELNRYRRDSPQRPLILIAHSFGGLVVMRILIDAFKHYDDIYISIVGLVFFGTPFRGSGELSQTTLLRLAHAQNETVDESQLRNSAMESHYLKDLLDDFLATLRNIPKPHVLCLYEMQPTNVAVIFNKKQVETNYCLWVNQTSATLDRMDDKIQRLPRQCDHLRLNKYNDAMSSDFQSLAAILSRMSMEGRDLSCSRQRALAEYYTARAARSKPSQSPTLPVDSEKLGGEHALTPNSQRARTRTPIVAQVPQENGERAVTPESRKANTVMPNHLPQWDNLECFDASFGSQGQQLFRMEHRPTSLDDLITKDAVFDARLFSAVIHFHSQPFLERRNTTLHFARIFTSGIHYYVEIAKHDNSRSEKMLDCARMSHLYRSLAIAFDTQGSTYNIDFEAPSVFRALIGPGRSRWIRLQPWLDNSAMRYDVAPSSTDHSASIDEDHAALCSAFSHWTLAKTRGKVLVNDLNGNNLILREPAVHTLDKDKIRFGGRGKNKYERGINAFLETHVCNHYCDELLLPSLAIGFNFRCKKFKSVALFSCANRLCRRLFRAPSLRTIVEDGEYLWCAVCSKDFHVRKKPLACRVCQKALLENQSPFFYESQGWAIPDTCVDHRTK